MDTFISPEIREVMEAVHFCLNISIIMPFEPKMSSKRELTRSLKIVVDKVVRELRRNYPEEMSMVMIQKLDVILSNLNFRTHKKSVVIYISPVFEKVLYLDIPVEERIIVDESFEIRELVYNKKQLKKYLVLVLCGKEYRMYFSDSNTFEKIVSNTPQPLNASINEIPGGVANFSNIAKKKEIVMDQFLHHIDNTLNTILNVYHLPLFVLGTEKIVGHFKHHSKHTAAVIEYVHGSYSETSFEELKEVLKPYIADWKKVMQKDLLNQLEEAAGKKKLAVGINNVWREAMNHNGRLLVLEKNYTYAEEHGSIDDVIYKAVKPYSKFSYIKDEVDDLIEKVLENGGDVEFVDTDIMKDYHHIAMVQYY